MAFGAQSLGIFSFIALPGALLGGVMDTLARLQEVFRNVFDDDSLRVGRETTARDIEAWDSVQNITLMLDVEGIFGVRFSTSEMAYLKNVGELVDLIDKKLKK